jgi:hypothetical protein
MPLEKVDDGNPAATGTTRASCPPLAPGPWRWAMCAALGGMILWSCRAFFDYGVLWSNLRGKTLVERGRLGCDESHCFLARAGRVWLHEKYATRKSLGLSMENKSLYPQTWVVIAEAERMLPADAHIYLNIPDTRVYYYGTFLWYPREVDVNTRKVVINDDETLQQNAVRVDQTNVDQLRRAGYTHIVTGTPGGVALIDLRAPGGETTP